jgi:hypothetical protein
MEMSSMPRHLVGLDLRVAASRQPIVAPLGLFQVLASTFPTSSFLVKMAMGRKAEAEKPALVAPLFGLWLLTEILLC